MARTNADKRLCVELLLQDEEWRQWSDRAIAKAVRVSYTFVQNLRKATDNVVSSDEPRKGLDGKKRKKPARPKLRDLVPPADYADLTLAELGD